MRKQFDDEMKQIEQPTIPTIANRNKTAVSETVQKYIESMSIASHTNEEKDKQQPAEIVENDADKFEHCPPSISSETDDQPTDLDPNSREYRYKMVEKMLSDVRSVRSYSTTASTIAPSLIKSRVLQVIDKKEKQDARKRCVAKGEANAVTRARKENSNTVKQYDGWDL